MKQHHRAAASMVHDAFRDLEGKRTPDESWTKVLREAATSVLGMHNVFQLIPIHPHCYFPISQAERNPYVDSKSSSMFY